MRISATSIARALAVALVFVLPVAAGAQATGRIQGRITNAASLGPLSDVQISVVGTGLGVLGVLSDNAGRFLVVGVPAGRATVRADLIGYSSATLEVEIGAGQATVANFTLRESAITLDEIYRDGHGRRRLSTADRERHRPRECGRRGRGNVDPERE